MPLDQQIALDCQAFDFVRVLYSSKLLNVLKFIVGNRYMGQVIEVFDAFQRLKVIMAQKELLDVGVLLLQMRIQCRDV